ncbi:MAG: hypothetical protein FWH38_03030 [Treponema sp.]|nr:hypothetical protein [Treponema sp.]
MKHITLSNYAFKTADQLNRKNGDCHLFGGPKPVTDTFLGHLFESPFWLSRRETADLRMKLVIGNNAGEKAGFRACLQQKSRFAREKSGYLNVSIAISRL